MRILSGLLILCCLFLFSCQKEVNFSRTNGGNGNAGSGSLLIKKVSKEGADSIVTVYTYNAGKKLINEKVTGILQSVDQADEYRYYRNASGIITHYVEINPDLIAAGFDSITTVIHYDQSSSRYISSALVVDVGGGDILMDSSVFVYDAGGKIIRIDVYDNTPLGSGNGYNLSGKEKFTYTAGNISLFEVYDIDMSAPGVETFVGSTRFDAFDTRTTPIILNNEAFAIGHPDWISVNNITMAALTDPDPTNNQTLAITYTYNSDNRPATSIQTINPGNEVSTTTYYYQ